MFRILTEDKNRDGILAILDSYVDGYTLSESIGAWKGIQEKSLAIDFVDVPRGTVESIARIIKKRNDQDAVLILDIPVTAQFI